MIDVAKRNKEEEKLHDFVLDELKKFHERKMEACQIHTNPGSKKNFDIDGLYPDLISSCPDEQPLFEELETLDSVNQNELDKQWVDYSKLDAKRILRVPESKKDDAIELLKKANLEDKIEVRSYEIKKGWFRKRVEFEDLEF